MDQLKKDVVLIALVTGELKTMGRKFKDYLDNYDKANEGIIADTYEKLIKTDEDAESAIRFVVNELYNKALEQIKQL